MHGWLMFLYRYIPSNSISIQKETEWFVACSHNNCYCLFTHINRSVSAHQLFANGWQVLKQY